MEENKFDPLQFIGFLLVSGILMFWFYDNQSNLIESQEAIVDDTNVQAVEQPQTILIQTIMIIRKTMNLMKKLLFLKTQIYY